MIMEELVNSMEYALGFLFSVDFSRVVLIRKNNPEWQRNMLNGVGGKLETNETPIEAMEREFFEETGVKTGIDQGIPWHYLARLSEPNDFVVHVFTAKAYSEDIFRSVKTTTDELVVIRGIADMSGVLGSVTYLVPLCRDYFRKDSNLSSVVINFR